VIRIWVLMNRPNRKGFARRFLTAAEGHAASTLPVALVAISACALGHAGTGVTMTVQTAGANGSKTHRLIGQRRFTKGELRDENEGAQKEGLHHPHFESRIIQ
jgi:hypothetical protein